MSRDASIRQAHAPPLLLALFLRMGNAYVGQSNLNRVTWLPGPLDAPFASPTGHRLSGLLLTAYQLRVSSPAIAARPGNAETPPASATTYPPAAWRCSTLGDGGLSIRVRKGIGRSPPPWSHSRGAFPRAFDGRAGRPRATLAAAWRPTGSDRAQDTRADVREELGLLVALG